MGAMAREPGEIRAGRDQATVEAVREAWRDLLRAEESLERAIEWYPTNARYLLESARYALALAAHREKALAVVTDLEALPFDARERAVERYRRALECSEVAVDDALALTEAEESEAKKAVE